MTSRSLLIIEPWVCHYEILPTITYSAYGLFDKIVIKTLDINEAKKCVKQYTANNEIDWQVLWSNNDERKMEGDVAVWLNTTHIHGNKISYVHMLDRVVEMLKSDECKKIFIVIHNQHDKDWYESLWTNCDSQNRKKINLIALSEDTYYKYRIGKHGGKIIKVCILEKEGAEQKRVRRESIRLCIVGMCREGKNFKNTIRYESLIKKEIIEFVYCGWIPSMSIKESGLLDAVKNGAISEVLGSSKRVEDTKMHSFIQNSDAIIDLKIPKNNDIVLMSSGNVGLSIALNIPLIAHRRNYPSHNCIRYKDYDDLLDILLQRNLKEVLDLQKIFLKEYQQDCIKRAKELWEYRAK